MDSTQLTTRPRTAA